MAASELRSGAASPQTTTPAGWNADVLQLTTLLMLSAQDAVRRRVTELYRARMRLSLGEVLSALEPLVEEIITGTTEAMAQALGTGCDAVVRNALPRSMATELGGRHGVERRLDRVWGARGLASLEASSEMRLIWPGPRMGHALLLHGRGGLNGAHWNPHQTISLSAGDTMQLQPGAVALLDEDPVVLVVGAVLAAGLRPRCLDAASGMAVDQGVLTPLGRVEMENHLLHLNQRQIMLTGQEARAMRCLTAAPGQVVEREELARLLGVQPRGVDRVMVGLRNKIGDGLITTVYGSGYILETSPSLE